MRIMQAEETIQQYITQFEIASFLNEDLLQHLQLFHFPAYSNVYIEQDEQHSLYFLVKGQVQCNHYHLNGKLAVFALSSPFTTIGDFEILTDERVSSNVIAMEDTVMLGIASHFVDRYGANDPRFLRFLIDQLRGKLYKMNTLQMNQLLPVISRLAVYILAEMVDNDRQSIVLPNKEDLASLLGTTSRHLNRVLKELVEAGAIRVDYPKIEIVDRSILQNFTH